MISLFVLVVSFILLREVGWLGVHGFFSQREAGRGALLTMFLFTGAGHFTSMKHDFAAMSPDALPDGLWVIYLTGVFGIAGAIGLIVPGTRGLAGVCLALLLGAMFPANVNAALNGISLGAEEPASLWLRTPVQLFYIGMVWWTSIREHPEELGPPPAEEPVVDGWVLNRERRSEEARDDGFPDVEAASRRGGARGGGGSPCQSAVGFSQTIRYGFKRAYQELGGVV